MVEMINFDLVPQQRQRWTRGGATRRQHKPYITTTRSELTSVKRSLEKKKTRVSLMDVNCKVDRILQILSSWNNWTTTTMYYRIRFKACADEFVFVECEKYAVTVRDLIRNVKNHFKISVKFLKINHKSFKVVKINQKSVKEVKNNQRGKNQSKWGSFRDFRGEKWVELSSWV